jgi:hypothetical protein
MERQVDVIEGRSDHGYEPGCVAYVGAITLFAFGAYLGFMWQVWFQFTTAFSPWGPAICIPILAIGAEWLLSGALRWWIRPCLWGLAIGSIGILVYLVSMVHREGGIPLGFRVGVPSASQFMRSLAVKLFGSSQRFSAFLD